MKCDTCGIEAKTLKRLVLCGEYNALIKLPLWNCKKCYDRKNRDRNNETKRGSR